MPRRNWRPKKEKDDKNDKADKVDKNEKPEKPEKTLKKPLITGTGPKKNPTPPPRATQVGLLVTAELEQAIADCKAKVDRISKQCRAKNRRFRDIEFDLENDKSRCLYGILVGESEDYSPSDVQRVTQIFDKPQFFAEGGADATSVAQGALGDCWFISALATVSTFPGLIEKICVARDELVGVYGFLFFKDNAWTSVIIDDMLYTRVPKYEELKYEEKELYHFDKDFFNQAARKNGKTLYFAKSGASGETWVPLIEKAYAKLHGNYSSLKGGEEAEAIEDLTGGVSTTFLSKDILDVDVFWKEELCRANEDRLFGCAFGEIDKSRSGAMGTVPVQGLFGDHAYSVLRAVECNGKRFVICRNPWGASEWTGRWSDGSKEWTHEWLAQLPKLKHQFGDDGQFLMEYSDWLATFSQIDRTIIFDSSWSMSSEWLRVPVAPPPAPWSFGDVSYTFEVEKPTKAIIVLSQLDERYFRDLIGTTEWTLDFVVVKEGEEEPIAESNHSQFWQRSVNADIELEAGKYYVYARLDRTFVGEDRPSIVPPAVTRKLSRVLARRAASQSIASKAIPDDHDLLDFDFVANGRYLPTTLKSMVKSDLNPDPTDGMVSDAPVTTTTQTVNDDGSITINTISSTTFMPSKEKEGDSEEWEDAEEDEEEEEGTDEKAEEEKKGDEEEAKDEDKKDETDTGEGEGEGENAEGGEGEGGEDDEGGDEEDEEEDDSGSSGGPSVPTGDYSGGPGMLSISYNDLNTIYLGLRVYTDKEVPVTINGRLPLRFL
ncbi:hypothetical protein BJ165DRAFT_1408041 [Panaeolus papilionaceus]|nr:hypothetical protein BJ165DRAFT_1408041 [Panaeolus papilionaceus]